MLSASVINNRSSNITGALIFDGRYFVQILEGDNRAVRETFSRIEADERHHRIKLIEWVSGVERCFDKSWMCGIERNDLNAAIFAPYLQWGRFDPANMTATQVLGLLSDLEHSGMSRAQAA